MPICKNCHARITKFDKDICPVCGAKNPLDGVTSDTIEITHEIDANNPEFKHSIPRTKKKTLLLFCLLGWTAIGFAYLRHKAWVIATWIAINIAIIGGVGALFMLLTPVSGFGFLISAAISYLINSLIGLYFKFVPNRKDGQGELIL